METARTPLQSEADIHAREACFHDGWAESTRLEEIKVYECFEAVTAMENQFILSRLGVHPNQDRYWKRILCETPQRLWWWMPFRALDTALTRMPLVRWLSWKVVMWGEKGAREDPRGEAQRPAPPGAH